MAVVGHWPGLAVSGLDPGASVRVQRVRPTGEDDQQAREKPPGPHVDRCCFEEQVLDGGRNDATPASGHRLLNAENDAYGNESGNDLTPRHLTFITSPGGVLTVKWEQPVHASTVSLNELFSRADETASRGPDHALFIPVNGTLTPRTVQFLWTEQDNESNEFFETIGIFRSVDLCRSSSSSFT